MLWGEQDQIILSGLRYNFAPPRSPFATSAAHESCAHEAAEHSGCHLGLARTTVEAWLEARLGGDFPLFVGSQDINASLIGFF